jgi:N-methylhydantoinase B
MGAVLVRAAHSANIKERRDCSTAVFDPGGRMVMQAEHIPVHLGAMPAAVKAVLDADHRPGRSWILNDPFAGGTHLPDITVVAPVFIGDETAPRFFVASRAHHADVGGSTAGSLPISSSIDEEGVRIPPSRLDEAMIDHIATQTRTPDERRGDLFAQLASLDVGIQRLRALCDRYSPVAVSARAAALQQYTERFIRTLVASLPDGEYAATDHLDDDGHDPSDGGRRDIAIRCVITIEGDHCSVDFRASDEQVRGPVNAVRAITLSAVMYCLRCLAPADLPSNAGVLRAVEVLTRPGSIVDALPPSAVAGGNVETSQRIVDAVFGALARAMPARVPAASCGSMNNLTIGSLAGDAPAFAYYETIAGGAGASAQGDGGSAVHTHMTNTRNTPVEALEHTYPFRVTRYRIREGSGGAGGHRGGDGVERAYLFDRPAQVTLLTERRTHPPYGLAGGKPASRGRNTLARHGQPPQTLPGKCTVHVQPGDELTIETPGGGGWGESLPDAPTDPAAASGQR